MPMQPKMTLKFSLSESSYFISKRTIGFLRLYNICKIYYIVLSYETDH